MHETLCDNLLQQIALVGYPTCMWVPTQCSPTTSMLFEYLSQSLWLTSDCFRILVTHMIDIGLIGLEIVGVVCCLVVGSCWLDHLFVDGRLIRQVADHCLTLPLEVGSNVWLKMFVMLVWVVLHICVNLLG